MSIEGTHREFVKRGYEDHGRHELRSDLAQHIEAIQLGHLYVEKQKIRL